jgi:hypothetical protein
MSIRAQGTGHVFSFLQDAFSIAGAAFLAGQLKVLKISTPVELFIDTASTCERNRRLRSRTMPMLRAET